MSLRRSDWLWLGGILSLALVLRAFKLDAGLWYDEILTLVTSVRLPTRELLTTYTSLNNHILYSLEAQGSIALLGESAWTLRLPALIFGVASVGALWWLARLVASPWEANLSALLMAVSYHHVWFSQNARGYTGLLFWSLLATIFFLQSMRRPSWWSWVGYGCVLAVAVYTHLSAAFFFAAHGIVYAALLLRRRLNIRVGGKIAADPYAEIAGLKPLFGFALGGVLILAAYAVILPQMMETFGSMLASPAEKLGVEEWKSPIWTMLEIIRNLQELGVVMSVGLPMALVFVSIGVVSLFKHHPVFAAFFVVHIPLTMGVLLAFSFNIWPRFFFIDMGFILVSLVRGVFVVAQYLARILKTQERWRISGNALGILATMIGFFVSLALLPPNYRYPKQDFLGARDYIEANRAADDRVASFGLATLAFASYYAPDWDAIETRDQLDRLRDSHRTWVIYTFPRHTEVNYSDILDSIASDFDLIKEFPGTLSDGSVLVFRSQE